MTDDDVPLAVPRALALVFAIALLAFGLGAGVAGATVAGAQQRLVVVNGVRLAPAALRAVELRLGVRIANGAYWYDRVSGAFGRPGGPTAGFIAPGLRVGGRLAANASRGHTGVFVNGRELPALDRAALSRIVGGAIPSGRYWLDSRGNYGAEGRPASGNLIRVAHSGSYQASTYGGYIGTDGTTSYFLDGASGCSVISGEGVSC
jgi:hypothetical protein